MKNVILTVDLKQYNVIMTALLERPAKEVTPLINEITIQVQNQVQSAQKEEAQQEQDFKDFKALNAS